MENDKPAPRQSVVVVTYGEDHKLLATTEFTDQSDANAEAEKIAKANVGNGISVGVYRRIATYEAEVKVTMKREGE